MTNYDHTVPLTGVKFTIVCHGSNKTRSSADADKPARRV